MVNGPHEDDGRGGCDGIARILSNYGLQSFDQDLDNGTDLEWTVALASIGFYPGHVFPRITETGTELERESMPRGERDPDDKTQRDALIVSDAGEGLQESGQTSAWNLENVQSHFMEEQKYVATEVGCESGDDASAEMESGAVKRAAMGTQTENATNGKVVEVEYNNSAEEVVSDSVETSSEVVANEIEKELVKKSINRITEDDVNVSILDRGDSTCFKRRMQYKPQSAKERVRKIMSSAKSVRSFGEKKAVVNDDDERWRTLRRRREIGMEHEAMGSSGEEVSRRRETRRSDVRGATMKTGDVKRDEVEKADGSDESKVNMYVYLDFLYEELKWSKMLVIYGSAAQQDHKKEY